MVDTGPKTESFLSTSNIQCEQLLHTNGCEWTYELSHGTNTLIDSPDDVSYFFSALHSLKWHSSSINITFSLNSFDFEDGEAHLKVRETRSLPASISWVSFREIWMLFFFFFFIGLWFVVWVFWMEWLGSSEGRLLFGKLVLPELNRGECLDWHLQNISFWPIIKTREGQKQHYNKNKH